MEEGGEASRLPNCAPLAYGGDRPRSRDGYPDPMNHRTRPSVFGLTLALVLGTGRRATWHHHAGPAEVEPSITVVIPAQGSDRDERVGPALPRGLKCIGDGRLDVDLVVCTRL